jgi:hypothetical protein
MSDPEPITPPTSSDDVADLFGAFAKAQGKFEVPKRSKKVRVQTKTGGSYEYAYATLDDIVAAIREPLAANGLSFFQPATSSPGFVQVSTRLVHESGQWCEFGPFTLPSAGGPQDYGSTLTYARRYALSTSFGIVTEEDDDGQLAQTAGSTADRSGKASPAQMKSLHAIAKEKGVTHEQMTDWAGRHLGIESLTELTKAGASKMRESLDGLPTADIDAERQVPSP